MSKVEMRPHDRPKHTRTSKAFDSLMDEMDATFQEGLQTELDEGAAKRIEEQLQAISKRLDRQIENDLAEIRASGSTPPKPAWQKIIGILLLLALIGAPLENTIGESFVFSYSNEYKSVLPTFFALTLPTFAILMIRLEKQQRYLSNRCPNWAFRWFIAFPLLVVFSSFCVVFSPFGWSALYGWAIGSETQPRQAKVLSVGPIKTSSKGCTQKAKLYIDGIQADICVEGKVIGPALKAGNTVSVHGRSSSFGLFIEEIHVTPSS